MRTTIDLPDDLHRAAVQLAHEHRQSLSRTVAELVRTALQGQPDPEELEINPVTGLAVIRLGRSFTAKDVAAALEDDGA